jgi:hypothetical protein
MPVTCTAVTGVTTGRETEHAAPGRPPRPDPGRGETRSDNAAAHWRAAGTTPQRNARVQFPTAKIRIGGSGS